jgi:hypothetical protein
MQRHFESRRPEAYVIYHEFADGREQKSKSDQWCPKDNIRSRSSPRIKQVTEITNSGNRLELMHYPRVTGAGIAQSV